LFFIRHLAKSLFLFVVFVSAASAQSGSSILPGPKPPDAPPQWKKLIGVYADKQNPKITYILLEQDGKLFWRDEEGTNRQFVASGDEVTPAPQGTKISSRATAHDKPSSLSLCCRRTDPGADASRFFRIQPSQPIEKLRMEALAALPPEEKRTFRAPDLVELAPLDPLIHLDIRYATESDFLGVPVYTEARAFLQRPAAEALLRVLGKLQPLGYGLLIYDGYRPWYVTKIFWDATPPEGKIFVADPAQGSRHNRACAVDLTLYDLKTGKAVEMTGEYDEMSPRSFPNYPGGTSLERWHRDLLRRAMESEGFAVYESEWWHFDYKDWREYGILNIPFEKLGIGGATK